MKRILILLAVLVVGTHACAQYLNGFIYSKPIIGDISSTNRKINGDRESIQGYRIDLGTLILFKKEPFALGISTGFSEYSFSTDIYKEVSFKTIHIPLYILAASPSGSLSLTGMTLGYDYDVKSELRDRESETGPNFEKDHSDHRFQGLEAQIITPNGIAYKFGYNWYQYKYSIRNGNNYGTADDSMQIYTLGLGYYFK